MMKKLFEISLTITISSSLLNGQTITFNKNYNSGVDNIFNVNEINNGYYSSMLETFFYNKLIIVKTNMYGDTIFQKVYGNPNQVLSGYSFISTYDSNFISGSFLYDILINKYCLYLLKVNSIGDSIWQSIINPPGAYNYLGQYIIETTDRGFLISGQLCDTLVGTQHDCNAMILKTDSLGNEIWHYDFGGLNFDALYSSVETSDKGFLSLGWTRSFGFANSMNRDIYLVKIDSLGNFQWQKTFGNSNHETGIGISKTQDGNYLIAGATYDFSSSSMTSNIIKIDTGGNLKWQQNYGFTESNEFWWAREVPGSLDIVAAGSRSRPNGLDDGWIVLADSAGNMKWERAYRKNNDYSYFRDVQPTSDGGFICAGFVFSGSSGNQDGWLVKLDSNGCLANNCGVLTGDDEIISSTEKKAVYVYPNPCSGVFFVKYNIPEDDYFTVTIFNSIGQQVLQKGFPNNSTYTFPISLKNFPKGLYFVKVGNEKHWESMKLVKE